MKVAFILCAKDMVIDRSSNATSIFNIFDDLSAPAFPVFLAPFSVLTVLERKSRESENQQFNLQVKIAGQQILSQDIPVDFQGKTRVRNLVQFTGLPLIGPGRFEVIASKNGQLLATYYFNVTHSGPIEPKNKISERTGAFLLPIQAPAKGTANRKHGSARAKGKHS